MRRDGQWLTVSFCLRAMGAQQKLHKNVSKLFILHNGFWRFSKRWSIVFVQYFIYNYFIKIFL